MTNDLIKVKNKQYINGICLYCKQLLNDPYAKVCTDIINCEYYKRIRNKFNDFCYKCNEYSIFFPCIIDNKFYCQFCSDIILKQNTELPDKFNIDNEKFNEKFNEKINEKYKNTPRFKISYV